MPLAKSKPRTVDGYLAGVKADQQFALKKFAE